MRLRHLALPRLLRRSAPAPPPLLLPPGLPRALRPGWHAPALRRAHRGRRQDALLHHRGLQRQPRRRVRAALRPPLRPQARRLRRQVAQLLRREAGGRQTGLPAHGQVHPRLRELGRAGLRDGEDRPRLRRAHRPHLLGRAQRLRGLQPRGLHRLLQVPLPGGRGRGGAAAGRRRRGLRGHARRAHLQGGPLPPCLRGGAAPGVLRAHPRPDGGRDRAAPEPSGLRGARLGTGSVASRIVSKRGGAVRHALNLLLSGRYRSFCRRLGD